MRIIPAIDIIGGKCVRLTKGDYDTKKIYNENPLDSILVSSNYDFDGTQVAGVSLNKNFVYYNDSYLNLSPLDEMRVTNSTHDNFLDDPIPKKIDLLLVSPPNLPSYQQFKMKFFFRDGSTKEDSTSKIYLY